VGIKENTRIIRGCDVVSDDLLKRYKKALEGLTVGGSEYYDEPERCAKDIKARIDSQDELVKKLIMQRNRIYQLPVIGWIVKKVN
jgi:hypothetical protein